MDLREIGRDMEWIHVAEGRNQWRVLVNTVVNFGFYKMLEISYAV
jgi:hypothetical protein